MFWVLKRTDSLSVVTLLSFRPIHNMVPFYKYRNCCANAWALLDKESQYWVVKSVLPVSRAGEFMSSEEVVGFILRLFFVTFSSMKEHVEAWLMPS